ncbi:MAG: thiol reductant ABC exporter subunit CydC, partial [Chloroflexota bacterium]
RAVLRYLERLVSHSVNFRLLARLRVWFYRRVEPIAPARISFYQSGDLLQRAIGDIETLENFYVRVVAPPVSALLVVAGVGWFVNRYDPLLAIVLVLGLLLGGGILSMLAYWLGSAGSRRWIVVRARLNAAVVEGVQGLSDLTAYGQVETMRAQVHGLIRETSIAQRGLVWGNGALNGLMVWCTHLTLLAIIWLAVPLVSQARLDGTALAVLAMITLACFEAVTPLPQAAQLLQTSLTAAGRLFALADERAEISDPAQPAPAPLQPKRIVVSNLTFRYPDQPEPALRDLSLELSAGKRIALVGASGAGKTTLLNILLRFWEYADGSVQVDGVELKSLSGEDARQMFSVISAAPFLFNATLRQNLLLADPAAKKSDLLQALELAGLGTYLNTLPLGLDAWIGEHGQWMSGGERQRLAIARALLRQRTFVLLDEPSASLDALTERQVLDHIFTVFEQRGILWITHRLVGMERMDEIILLQNGKVTERGKHHRLLEAGGGYWRMWRSQQRILWDTPGDLLF